MDRFRPGSRIEAAGWIQTYSGKPFWPLNPRVEDVDVADIAHALSRVPRYLGHTIWHYSIAEHALLVSQAAPPELKMQALFHDASEAYLPDMPSPIKTFIPGYKEWENTLMTIIAEAIGFEWPESAIVKELDRAILKNEREVVMNESVLPWAVDGTGIANVFVIGYEAQYAEELFLKEYKRLLTLRK